MPYFRPWPASEVRCDRCGHDRHFPHPDDPDRHDPQGDWCWTPLWSLEPVPCACCGANVNVRVPFDVIVAERAATQPPVG